jgi:hypothetical protein
MAGNKRRITLEQPTGTGWWSRLLAYVGLDRTAGVAPPPPEGVDFSLAKLAERRAVRAFIEAIDTYQLHTRRTVHVVSTYCIPSDPGLEQRVPEWLAERVRFGVVRGEMGDIGYLRIKSVEVQWGPEGTELYLYLAQKVVPGTRAFVAAYLGDAARSEEMDALPSTLLLGEPR